MKTLFKIIGLSLVMTILWIAGIMLVQSILQVEIPQTDDPGKGLMLILLCCLLQVLALHWYLVHSRLTRWPRFWMVLSILVLLQFLLPQVESWFYLSQDIMSKKVIVATALGGILMAIVYASITLFAYSTYNRSSNKVCLPSTGKDWKLLVLSGTLLYPLLYFLAGYFIAWQNPVLREYYSGSDQLSPFFQIMYQNLLSGSVFIQMIRGMIWAGLGISLIKSLDQVSRVKQYWIIGVLFAVISSAQLLIPNPYMPESVRWSHLLELFISTFVWGVLLVWYYFKFSSAAYPGRKTPSEPQNVI